MNKIELLQERKRNILGMSAEVRKEVSALIDAESFVELSAFNFSKSELYEENGAGEGVITGFATIENTPVYIVAQNVKETFGGISKVNCEKIVKCLEMAEKNGVPVVYVLNTRGVQIGEGVTVLEGLSKWLIKAVQLKGIVPQYVVVNGEVYGSVSALSAIADFTFFIKNKSVLALNSPFVLSAKAGKNLSKEEVGGAQALDKTGVVAFETETMEEVREKLAKIFDLLAMPIVDAELNDAVTELNEEVSAENVLNVFETSLEIGAEYEKEVKTILGRIGGIAVASILFDGGENGVELNMSKMSKIKSFVEFASSYGLPLVIFADVKGIAPCMSVNNSLFMKAMGAYLSVLDSADIPKISVVYKKAIGVGYSLFAAKSLGLDYTCAFANAKISLFDGLQGAKIEWSGEKADDVVLAQKYADENADPIHAAKDGYIDAIIEPQFVKQYLISALQMCMR